MTHVKEHMNINEINMFLYHIHSYLWVCLFAAVVVVSGGGPVGPTSQVMQCPSCHATISTRVSSEAVTKTHLMALLLCVFLLV